MKNGIRDNSWQPKEMLTATLLFFLVGGPTAQADDAARQAHHLLANKCFVCHGPDRNSEAAKETDLRLDLRKVALEYDAIVPSDPGASELIKRITSQDSDSQMPPPGHGELLSKHEVDVLRRWIKAGAIYEMHWSFQKLQETEIPKGTERRSSGNPIDAFVLRRLGETKGLTIDNVKLTAVAVNTTVDGVTNKAAGDVYAGQYSQKSPTILEKKTHEPLDDGLATFVSKAYRLALNREPSKKELQVAIQFIIIQQKDYEQNNSAHARSTALTDFAHAIFSLNEFIYVD